MGQGAILNQWIGDARCTIYFFIVFLSNSFPERAWWRTDTFSKPALFQQVASETLKNCPENWYLNICVFQHPFPTQSPPKELQLDWRVGAELFESRLVDYDVSANWGNWMRAAGVAGVRHLHDELGVGVS